MMWSRNVFPVVTFALAVGCVCATATVVESRHGVSKIQHAVQRALACEKDSDCGGLNDVKCTFDSVDEKTKVCQCDNKNKTYVPRRKQCALPCQKSSECVGGRCRLRVEEQKFCSCLRGYSGDFCEISACETLCGKDNDVHCDFEDNSDDPYCVCPEEKQGFDYDTKSCRECDCGHWDAMCEYHGNNKECHCGTGTYEKDGKCEDCDCGEFRSYHGCEFQDGEKKCLCNEFFKLKDGKCTLCDCGWYDVDCKFEDGKQICTCKEGYLQDNDNECRGCFCGRNGNCSFDEHNWKVCTCAEGYASRSGFCQPCKCSGGTENNDCEFSYLGEMECNCKEGFKQNDSECLECDCGEYGLCHFDSWSGQKECICEDGYREEDGKCIEK